MQGPEILIPLCGIAAVFGIPISAIWTAHKRQMLELQIRLKQMNSPQVNDASVEALRQELRSLRDTTTQYDLSFDTALQRLERRVEQLEQTGSVVDDQRLEMRNGR
jgi:exonuclease VII small subunit